jgi:hypothetical protein
MKNVFFRNFATFTLMVGLTTPTIALAEMVDAKGSANFDSLEAVDNDTLDTMRGGFVMGNGVTVDIGVQKASYVDGVLQVQNSFRVADVALLERTLGSTVSSGDLQNVSSSFGTLIQNNLDQKTIQNLTVIDVNVRNFSNLQTGFVESIRGLQDVQIVR